MRSSTVYLDKPVAPSHSNWVRGYITRHDARGVWLSNRDDGRGEVVFYPAHLIEKITYESDY